MQSPETLFRRAKVELRYRLRKRQALKLRGWLDADEVRDRYTGQQCIILGGSPTVPPTDLDLVARHPHVIAVNATVFSQPRCTFGVLTNLRFNRQLEADAIAAARCEYLVTVLDDPENLAKFSSQRCRTILTSHIGGGMFELRHSWNIKGLLPWGPTIVLDTALPLAVWCGFREILLVGCQYPLKGGYQRLNVSDKGDRRKLNVQAIHDEMHLAHEKWALWAREPLRDVRIVNCTPDSHIEVFPREQLADSLCRFSAACR